MTAPSLLFVGGVRSGKSALAQRWAEAQGRRRLFVATATADDAEMARRIACHRAARGQGWDCVEAPLDPVSALAACGGDAAKPNAIVLDCVSLWLANMLAQGMEDAAILRQVESLAAVAAAPRAPLAVVSLEAGQGMVPLSALGRRYQDILGTANQALARACSHVVLSVCGLPMPLKGALPEEIC